MKSGEFRRAPSDSTSTRTSHNPMTREKLPPQSAYRPLWHSELDATDDSGDALLIPGQRKLWEDNKRRWSTRKTTYALSLGLLVLFMCNVAFVVQIRRMRAQCFPSPQIIFCESSREVLIITHQYFLSSRYGSYPL